MKIPNEFREVMARNFYDKDMQIWTSKVAKDDEGSVISGGASEMIDSFKGNFQFKTREKIQEQYGQEVEANALITCNATKAAIGDIVVYNDKEYVITSLIVSDSHVTILVKGSDECV